MLAVAFIALLLGSALPLHHGASAYKFDIDYARATREIFTDKHIPVSPRIAATIPDFQGVVRAYCSERCHEAFYRT